MEKREEVCNKMRFCLLFWFMEGLSKLEMRALLAAARAHSERDWLMILVGFWHGLRASEVVGLKPNNIQDGYLTVRRLKGSLKTVQPLIEHHDSMFNERAALIEFAREVRGNQKLFNVCRGTFWRIVQRHCLAAGIPKHKAHPHALKHAIAMQTIESAGIENCRQWLGHKSISSTGEYLRVTDGQAATAVSKALGGRPVWIFWFSEDFQMPDEKKTPTKPPITLSAVLAVVDETHRRNVSEENWHSRVTNALKEKFGEALEGLGNAIGEAKFGE
jgi:integrase-like protein